MSELFSSLSPSEMQIIMARRIEQRQAFAERVKRLRQILKPMNKRDRRQWKAKYICGRFAFLDPPL